LQTLSDLPCFQISSRANVGASNAIFWCAIFWYPPLKEITFSFSTQVGQFRSELFTPPLFGVWFASNFVEIIFGHTHTCTVIIFAPVERTVSKELFLLQPVYRHGMVNMGMKLSSGLLDRMFLLLIVLAHHRGWSKLA
jgi:hypothetical protein